MATLQSGNSPGQRVKAGDWLIDSAEGVGVKPVAKRFGLFERIHIDYRKANDKSTKAVTALATAERKVGELDFTQDERLEAFAVARIAAGAPRQNPISEYKVGSVSVVKGMGHEKEAKVLLKMAAKAKNHPDAGVKKAAAAMEKAANAVLAAAKSIPGLIQARDAAMRARDAKGPGWEKAFAALKRAVRAAEDDGATGLFAALFEVEKPKAKPAKEKPAKDEPKA
jgi:hypothetical protein